MRSLWLVPSKRESSKICSGIGALTDQRRRRAGFDLHVLRHRSRLVLEKHRVRTRGQALDRQRRAAVNVSVNGHLRTGRLRSNLEFAEQG